MSCKWHYNPKGRDNDPSNGVLVMTYNILCDEHVDAPSYPSSAPEDLEYSQRALSIFQRIAEISPDICVLQEVDTPHLILPQLNNLGYQCTFALRVPYAPSAVSTSLLHPDPTGDMQPYSHEGLIVAWRASKWSCVSHCSMRYSSIQFGETKPQTAVCALLVSHDTKSSICVANTHIIFNPRRGDLKLGQVQTLTEGVRDWLSAVLPLPHSHTQTQTQTHDRMLSLAQSRSMDALCEGSVGALGLSSRVLCHGALVAHNTHRRLTDSNSEMTAANSTWKSPRAPCCLRRRQWGLGDKTQRRQSHNQPHFRNKKAAAPHPAVTPVRVPAQAVETHSGSFPPGHDWLITAAAEKYDCACDAPASEPKASDNASLDLSENWLCRHARILPTVCDWNDYSVLAEATGLRDSDRDAAPEPTMVDADIDDKSAEGIAMLVGLPPQLTVLADFTLISSVSRLLAPQTAQAVGKAQPQPASPLHQQQSSRALMAALPLALAPADANRDSNSNPSSRPLVASGLPPGLRLPIALMPVLAQAHLVLGGDLNSTPSSAFLRFLTHAHVCLAGVLATDVDATDASKDAVKKLAKQGKWLDIGAALARQGSATPPQQQQQQGRRGSTPNLSSLSLATPPASAAPKGAWGARPPRGQAPAQQQAHPHTNAPASGPKAGPGAVPPSASLVSSTKPPFPVRCYIDPLRVLEAAAQRNPAPSPSPVGKSQKHKKSWTLLYPYETHASDCDEVTGKARIVEAKYTLTENVINDRIVSRRNPLDFLPHDTACIDCPTCDCSDEKPMHIHHSLGPMKSMTDPHWLAPRYAPSSCTERGKVRVDHVLVTTARLGSMWSRWAKEEEDIFRKLQEHSTDRSISFQSAIKGTVMPVSNQPPAPQSLAVYDLPSDKITIARHFYLPSPTEPSDHFPVASFVRL